ncbi:MAG: hypothetical protein PHW73_13895 [Atribacterota bacterium]|nr:hypothetical protein [Atribacterota bacterium]
MKKLLIAIIILVSFSMPVFATSQVKGVLKASTYTYATLSKPISQMTREEIISEIARLQIILAQLKAELSERLNSRIY